MKNEFLRNMLDKSQLKDNGCIEFYGCKTEQGYGVIKYGGDTYRAHRLCFILYNKISGLEVEQFVCHSCDNPSCINPDHLWLGDAKSNNQDCVKKGRHTNKSKTHCKRGHELSGDNLINLKDNGRACRTCSNASKRAYKNKVTAIRRKQLTVNKQGIK